MFLDCMGEISIGLIGVILDYDKDASKGLLAKDVTWISSWCFTRVLSRPFFHFWGSNSQKMLYSKRGTCLVLLTGDPSYS